MLNQEDKFIQIEVIPIHGDERKNVQSHKNGILTFMARKRRHVCTSFHVEHLGGTTMQRLAHRGGDASR